MALVKKKKKRPAGGVGVKILSLGMTGLEMSISQSQFKLGVLETKLERHVHGGHTGQRMFKTDLLCNRKEEDNRED